MASCSGFHFVSWPMSVVPTPATSPSPTASFWTGVKAVLPMHLGVAPFGVIYGVIAIQAGIPPLAALLMSSVVFAGASQFLLAQMIGGGAPLLIAWGSVGLVNLRHALYSASVAPVLKHLPQRWKLTLAYLLTDEAYAAALPSLMSEPRSANAHWVLLGSGLGLWSGWQLATAGGVLLGAGLPTDLGLDFALPLTFIAIVVPMINSRARLLAALVAGIAALLLFSLPYKIGLLLAALTGLLAGAVMQRRLS
jgi:4-azaleucine resistance transporter AzlC